ncbi:PIG-L deacetylase family protein [Marinactinospora thermotolerans]|uniref:N-acetylglucosaminyl deacetylase, LmbE family n=2 Tax=Marinactinospora thermotolerans TaxID=531310 RepID=A0A1T4S5Y2_9ACTN|nr:PIG-L family deacetylase [Marinactinospora thermotolerans]AFO85452.1 N-acetylglucosaminylphosphatidylinositol deacetylase [Marinactinospora thermotolerans]SKA23572.1 N-acetylglucosaminyl deacetylase, LmbE family [Marinactinospora thermotolerans DSM 45154]
MTTSDDIPPLPEDWQRALAVVAHPDDLEFGASAAITRWVGQGRQVAELLVTRGEAGIDTIAPQECGPLRTAEQLAAARVVGVEEVAFLDFPDGSLQYGLDLRRELARAIRRHRPEVLISLNFRETFPGSAAFNHADHRALGPALLDAVRDAANRWMFPDLSDEGLRPWSGVRFAAFSGSPRATHHVPLSEGELAAGIASLAAHRAYLSALGGFDHEAFLTAEARSAGESCGTGLATLFEVIPT